MNLLESLKPSTTVVADTGDFEAIAEHEPRDATTNPSLIYQAAQKPPYRHLVDEALDFALHSAGDPAARSAAFMDKLFVTFGCEILKIVPGRVSTEVDAGLSFDTEDTLAKARQLHPDDRGPVARPASRQRAGVSSASQAAWENSASNTTAGTNRSSGCGTT
jgi:transaldolase